MARRLSRDEFRTWAAQQPGRYERVDGLPVAMSPERVQHVRVKNQVWAALKAAIRAAGVDCEALGDGVTVEIDDETDYEPHAVVNCRGKLPPDAVAAT
jgi:Uma2 family endonuclease